MYISIYIYIYIYLRKKNKQLHNISFERALLVFSWDVKY